MATFDGTVAYSVTAVGATFDDTVAYTVTTPTATFDGTVGYVVAASGSAVFDGTVGYTVTTAGEPLLVYRILAGRGVVPVQLWYVGTSTRVALSAVI